MCHSGDLHPLPYDITNLVAAVGWYYQAEKRLQETLSKDRHRRNVGQISKFKMTEIRLRQELEDSKAEITRLRESLATALPTLHKDLSLIWIVTKWSGAETVTPVEVFYLA